MSLIVLMMEVVQTSETSVNSYQSTRRNIAEDSHLHSRRSENHINYLRTAMGSHVTAMF
jgi:hypothetical protein